MSFSKISRIVFFAIFMVGSFLQPAQAEEKIIPANGIQLWTETFGNPKDPGVLLVMGGGGQGILWPDPFCRRLSDQGFFVIRYDNRDTGESTIFPKNDPPYTLLDMAKDAIGILDHYGISKAHVVGASMGGGIAQVIGGSFPDRVKSLTLMCTTPDLSVTLDAVEGKPHKGILPPPTKAYLDALKPLMGDENNKDGFMNPDYQLRIWEVCNGKKVPFEKEFYRDLIKRSLERTRNSHVIQNHIQAMRETYKAPLKLDKIKLPTLVIHGGQDPILPKPHGIALAKALPRAELLLIEDMGHNLNSHFYDQIIGSIVTHIRKS